MTKKISVIVSILWIAVFTIGITFAADVTVDDILNKLNQNQQQINTMKMTMTTKTTIEMPGKEPMTIVQRSTMIFKKPDKMKMEILSPMHQVIIRSGNKIYIKMPDGKIIKQDMREYGMQLPAMEFTPGTMQDFSKNYTTNLESMESTPSQGLYVLSLIPKQPDEIVSKMKMMIDYIRVSIDAIQIFNLKGDLLSFIETENQLIDKIWIPKKVIITSNNISSKSKIEVIYEKLEINNEIFNEEFNF